MKIRLRPVTIEDGSYIVKWRNTPSVSAHCLNQRPITIESNEAFFHANIETGHYLQYIVELNDREQDDSGKPIAKADFA